MSTKFRDAILPVVMVVGFVVCADVMALQAPPLDAQDAPVASPTADNTRVNQRDKSPDTIKPTDQPNNKADIKLLAAVRRAVVGDKSLSMLAHNAKIVVMSGAVMLRGPVKSQEEKTQVGKIVAAVPGVSEVTNELDIKQ